LENFRSFIADCKAAASSDDPAGGMQAVFGRVLVPGSDVIERCKAFDEEETLIHVDDDVSIVHVRLSPNIRFPPHGHSMRANIGVYRGSELNIDYSIQNRNLVVDRVIPMNTFDFTSLTRGAVHSVANRTSEFSGSIHVYLGNLITARRWIWHPETFEKFPYLDQTYFEFARPYDPNLPFERPEVCDAHSGPGEKVP
jgi:predicted metal-dependent enzyme (double-stranded beta helix superfamily)